MRSGEMTRVELSVGGALHHHEPAHRIAFMGRLLYDTDVEAEPRCMVFETLSKRLALYHTNAQPWRDEGATYQVFSTYEELAKSTDARNNFWLYEEQGRGEQEGISRYRREAG